MKSENELWKNYFLPQLERTFRDSIIVMLVRTYPKKTILEAAFYHVATPAEVYDFFIEYQCCCRMWQPDNPHSNQSTALTKIIGHMLLKEGRWLPLWIDALQYEIKAIEN